MITGICKECGKECTGHYEEVGIGEYEFWGQRGKDNRRGVFSDCYGEEMEDIEK